MGLVAHGQPAGGPGPHRGRVPAVRPHDRCAVPTGGTPADCLALGRHACADRTAPHPGCLRLPWGRGYAPYAMATEGDTRRRIPLNVPIPLAPLDVYSV